jgi:hypothetical protein
VVIFAELLGGATMLMWRELPLGCVCFSIKHAAVPPNRCHY